MKRMRLCNQVCVFPTIHTVGKHKTADSPIVRMSGKRGYEGREALGNRPHEDDEAE
jgi:hypothetical protein